ncbi:citrate lyase holo-[acyl-carrier protein] synthase [Isachenkonia alkalipeptolytica]|uniref:citrate lyase holo-[acyl-carrier protein] synthase n=1 Tax=Isachenkonia alkalipeptolytica TaxID=2565777 RepID=A0AA43XIG2_9CLOT|nr:citrate lyase holo-[acyl-carrier protein] synthase [Isachenkonia alkalipeptolytica]NBG87172.1 citrate lyase holo-[acyl-carrier protein] synthase [Isachenkonia alkalipeptolytica]
MSSLHQKVLEAKEERSLFQSELRNKHGLPVISLTLNLPGGFEGYEGWEAVFKKSRDIISKTFSQGIVEHHHRLGKWGPEGFWVVNLPAETVKKQTIEIEENHFFGRIFDLDVLNEAGTILSRRDFSMEGRQCVVCEKPALSCYRGQSHELWEVKEKVEEIICKGLSRDV